MIINKDRGIWIKRAKLIDDYAYHLFLNDYKYIDIYAIPQGLFVKFSDKFNEVKINNKPIKNYYSLANNILRKEKLLYIERKIIKHG